IPLFQEDQLGSAIITGSGFLKAVEVTKRDIGDIRLVVSGAGAAAIACTRLLIELGLDPDKVLMCDSRGVLSAKREINDPVKGEFVRETDCETLADALVGADAFMGLSVGGLVSREMVATMADKPIIFAMANPDPEIGWDDVMETCPDAVMATGRSDYPNQVNNVLGFPYIFRGALDVQATGINEPMKIAAVNALADLAREPVPASVSRAYGNRSFQFGADYIIPTPFDPRVLLWVAPAVAQAAMDSGVARRPIEDWDAYRVRLEQMMDPGRGLLRRIFTKARQELQRIVLPESTDPRVVKAASVLAREQVVQPVLLGNIDELSAAAEAAQVSLDGIEVIEPEKNERYEEYVARYLDVNKRRGATEARARTELSDSSMFGMMMVREGHADGIVVGATRPYAEAIRPALGLIGTQGRACGLHMVLTRSQTMFFADTTVNIDPDAETLADLTLTVARAVRSFAIEPRVAMLSFANFGAVRHRDCAKMAKAVALVRAREPDLMIEGEMQVDLAVDMNLRERTFPWSRLTETANTFIFPNLASANIAYKMLHQVGGASIFGPVLLGVRRPVNILAFNSDATDIVNLAAYTAVQAQMRESGEIP
ncbi:MAG: phosphate acyltransferase, partial [Myxococcota bacterium]|nr:phosphate acyltransferase [Myxococcota bacterium]